MPDLFAQMLARHLQQVAIAAARILRDAARQQTLEEDRKTIELLDYLEQLTPPHFTGFAQAKVAMRDKFLVFLGDQLSQRPNFFVSVSVHLQTRLRMHACFLYWCSRRKIDE